MSSTSSICKTSTSKTSTFYPKTLTGKNIDYLKHSKQVVHLTILILTNRIDLAWHCFGLRSIKLINALISKKLTLIELNQGKNYVGFMFC